MPCAMDKPRGSPLHDSPGHAGLVKRSLVTSGPPVERGLISRQGCYAQQCFGHHKSLRNSLVHTSSHLFGWAMPVLGYSHLMHTCLLSPSRKAGA